MKNILKHPLLRGSAILGLGSMLANIANLLYHMIIGRMLGTVDYGILASVFSILYIVSIIPVSGSVSIVKFISSANNKDELAKVYAGIKRFIWRIAFGGLIVLVLLSPVIANFLHITDLFPVLLAGPIFFFSLVTLLNQSTSQGMLRFLGLVGPTMLSSFGKLLIGIGFVAIGLGVNGAVFAVLLGVFFSYILSIRFIKDIKQSKPKEFEMSEFLKYSGSALIQAVAFTSIFTTDLLLVKHFLSPEEAGLYAALSTLGKIVFFASSPVGQAMFPIISGKVARGEKYKQMFFLSLIATFGISMVAVVVYALLPELIITTIYGNEFVEAAPLLAWMGLFLGLYSVSQLLVNFALAIGKTKVVYLPMFAAIVQIIGIIVWHDTLLTVIQISLFTITGLLITLLAYAITLSNRTRV